jgi:hypothetical protein
LSLRRLESTLFGMTRVLARAALRRVSTSAVAIAIVCSCIAPAVAVVPAAGVARHGVCVGGLSSWRLRATSDGAGALVVRFRLTGGSPGETWNLFLDDNGSGFFAGSRVSDATGLVRVRRSTDDLIGEDVIRAAGHDVATGEVCRGRVRI